MKLCVLMLLFVSCTCHQVIVKSEPVIDQAVAQRVFSECVTAFTHNWVSGELGDDDQDLEDIVIECRKAANELATIGQQCVSVHTVQERMSSTRSMPPIPCKNAVAGTVEYDRCLEFGCKP